MLNLRGDIHEGGGQILRTALALSARTGQAFQLTRIRAGRSRPGLQAQHLAAVELAAQICGARVEGAQKGSGELRFFPGPLRSGNFSVNIATAGSMTLLLQAIFWAVAVAPGECLVEVRGGSDVRWSPPLDYLLRVTLPLYQRLAQVESLEIHRGFFPQGGGLWRFRVLPGGSQARLNLDQPPHWGAIRGRAVVAESLRARRVGERLADQLKARQGSATEVEVEYVRTSCPGAALLLWVQDDQLACAASSLAEKGKSAEAMADEALHQLLQKMQSPEPVEEHLADQLIPLLALVGGQMKCQVISPHCLANLEVVSAFLGPRLSLEGNLLQSVT